MSDANVNIHVLDAAYKPFPTFEEWAGKTFVDTVRWERYISSLKAVTEGLPEEALQRAHNIAKRAAALDTGAIEGLYEVDRGFTYTVAVEAATWEIALQQKGEQVRSLFDSQLRAYDYVLDLATKAVPISEASVRVLHEVVTSAQEMYAVITAVGPQLQALPKGVYKSLPNHVRTRRGTNHSYAPVDVTPAEMARCISQLSSPTFLSAHPVLQASYAHYALVVIHPFADGNGRVARALASTFTYRKISMPIVILSEQKGAYLDSLEAADAENYQAFVDFMLARCLDTIELVSENVRAARAPSAEDTLKEIKALYITKGGYTIEQVDNAATRLLQEFASEISARLAVVKDSPVTPFLTNTPGPVQARLPFGYRFVIKNQHFLQIGFDSPAPAQAMVRRIYFAFVPKDPSGDDDIQIGIFRGSNVEIPRERFTARMDELIPGLSGVLQIRLGMFADRVIGELLAELGVTATMAKRKG